MSTNNTFHGELMPNNTNMNTTSLQMNNSLQNDGMNVPMSGGMSHSNGGTGMMLQNGDMMYGPQKMPMTNFNNSSLYGGMNNGLVNANVQQQQQLNLNMASMMSNLNVGNNTALHMGTPNR